MKQYSHEVNCGLQVNFLGIEIADPNEYISNYKHNLTSTSDLPQIAIEMSKLFPGNSESALNDKNYKSEIPKLLDNVVNATQQLNNKENFTEISQREINSRKYQRNAVNLNNNNINESKSYGFSNLVPKDIWENDTHKSDNSKARNRKWDVNQEKFTGISQREIIPQKCQSKAVNSNNMHINESKTINDNNYLFFKNYSTKTVFFPNPVKTIVF